MSVPASQPSATIVIPIFNEASVLPELFARLAAVFDAPRAPRWQTLLVDDGSRDRSAALVRAQAARDPRFALLEFQRVRRTCEAPGPCPTAPEIINSVEECRAAWRRHFPDHE
jgi:glycosyltransferase involved in cell wall biosynthesis